MLRKEKSERKRKVLGQINMVKGLKPFWLILKKLRKNR
jgi:hypothetical protein